MDYAKYQELSIQLIGQEFSDVELLVTAFTHRSYLNEHKKTVKEHNERN
jgi:ribonuclease III